MRMRDSFFSGTAIPFGIRHKSAVVEILDIPPCAR
jgi:hypothetical protein